MTGPTGPTGVVTHNSDNDKQRVDDIHSLLYNNVSNRIYLVITTIVEIGISDNKQ